MVDSVEKLLENHRRHWENDSHIEKEKIKTTR